MLGITESILLNTYNTPVEANARVLSKQEILNLTKPAIGLVIYCLEDLKYYKIDSLKDKTTGSIITPNALVDTYSELLPTFTDTANGFVPSPNGTVGYLKSDGTWSSSVGPTGADGQNGQDGADGLSAYEIAVNNGFVGTEQEWLLSLKGAKGDKGDTGAAGADGRDGQDGTTFTPSVSEDGILSWANDGEKSNPLSVNIKGPKGDPGTSVTIKGTDSSYCTEIGDGYIDLTDGHLYVLTSIDPKLFIDAGEIKGPKGDTGELGPIGLTGPAGEQGILGIPGEDGTTFIPNVSEEGVLSWSNDGGLDNPTSINIKGPQGEQGIQGEKGDTGDKGENGNKIIPYAYEPVEEDGAYIYGNGVGEDIRDNINPGDIVLVSSSGNLYLRPEISLFSDDNIVVVELVGNIKGPKGDSGTPTEYEAGDGIDITDNTISTTYIGKYSEYGNGDAVGIYDVTGKLTMDTPYIIVTSNGNAQYPIVLNNDTGVYGSITATNGFFDTSDIRKKNIISDISINKCYDLIDKCLTVIYTLKDLTKEQIGLIALEVEEFFPEVINTDSEGFKSLDYSKLTVICLKLIKDLLVRVEKIEKLYE